MAEFDFTLEHRPGKEHVVPDTLSRAPLPEPSTIGDNLVVFPTPVSGGSRPGHRVSGTQSKFPNLNENGQNLIFMRFF